ncbi:MAG: M14 family metallopeptidase [Caldilineaceae bacterium]
MFHNKIFASASLALALLVLLVMGVRAQGVPSDSHQVEQAETIVVTVIFHNQTELQWLASHVDVWRVDHAGRTVTALVTEAQIQALKARRFLVTPAAQQPVRAAVSVPAGGDDGTIPGYACYRTVEKTVADLDALTTEHPNLARWVDIGDSWDKQTPGGPAGYDLRVLVLTNQQSDVPKGRFFLMAAIHARELTTAETAARFAEYLVRNYGHDPDVTWMLDHNEVHILPFANPDGRKWAEQQYYWRKNTNTADSCVDPGTMQPSFPNYGVDLNRNSSFKWNACEGFNCSSGDACGITFRGSGPASEPETQAIQNYVASLFPDQRGAALTDAAPDDATGLLISLHSFSQLILYPWGWSDAPAPNRTQLATLGRKFGYFTGYDVCQSGEFGCIYQTDGSTDDWSYGELGIASYTFELGTEFFQSCSYFEEEILTDTLSSLLYAVKVARQPYLMPSGPDTLSVQLSTNIIEAGQSVTLTAQANDTRFDSNGRGLEPTQTIAAAVYAVDAPAWITDTALYSFTRNLPITGTFAMTATDDSFDGPVETVRSVVDTSDWPLVRHLLFVQSQDASGAWGAPSAAFVDVVEQLVYSATLTASKTVATRPGVPVAAEVLLRNTGTGPDKYMLHVAANEETTAWQIEAPAQIADLKPGNSISVPVTVAPPFSATVGVTNTILISATSQASGQMVGSGQIDVTVLPHQFAFPIAPRE